MPDQRASEDLGPLNEAHQTDLTTAILKFTSLRVLTLTLLTLTTRSLAELCSISAHFKQSLLTFSLENKGPLAPELRSSQNLLTLDETPAPFRDFCWQLSQDRSKVQELTLKGNVGVLNFLRALVLEVKHKELTSLQRVYIDECYLTQKP
mmetsp:Transcript_27746/g.37058  ORF Transcript_27746/g.37058 Transcript_27746/m.37058 type:complete len:150 (-) Transcript_27746:138-587(-)